MGAQRRQGKEGKAGGCGSTAAHPHSRARPCQQQQRRCAAAAGWGQYTASAAHVLLACAVDREAKVQPLTEVWAPSKALWL